MKENRSVHEAFTEMAPRYEEVIDGELQTFWGWNYQDFLDQLLIHTPIEDNWRILDVATGTSVIPRKIVNTNPKNIQIVGLDINETMLRAGRAEIHPQHLNREISLTCGDAMLLPYADHSFDLLVSGLASHHMDIPVMLKEMRRVLKPGGQLSIIDVGTSPFWELPIIRGLARIFAFTYFLFKENLTRAWAEVDSAVNLRTPEGWDQDLKTAGFQQVEINKLLSKYRWAPEPLSIRSIKSWEER
jgi:ubiquinone/menaquinone biosynthesis C-methylase UbiE